MRRNMQSKRRKPVLILVLLLLACAIVALMNVEPKLEQTLHEQPLDAATLGQ